MHQSVDILAIGIHPDDVELSCSGTLLRHAALGYSFAICDLTQGQLGSRGNPTLRMQEAEASLQVLGGQWRINLGMEDGFFSHDEAHIRKIVAAIRLARPQIVLANALSDRHPDHGRAAQLIADACFYAGLAKIETTWEGQAQAHHRPRAVYHYIQDRNLEPDLVVDISDHMETKMKAILSFESQFFTGSTDGPKTPISGKDFMDFMYAKNKAWGRDIGAEYAEAFNVRKHIGVKDLLLLG